MQDNGITDQVNFAAGLTLKLVQKAALKGAVEEESSSEYYDDSEVSKISNYFFFVVFIVNVQIRTVYHLQYDKIVNLPKL